MESPRLASVLCPDFQLRYEQPVIRELPQLRFSLGSNERLVRQNIVELLLCVGSPGLDVSDELVILVLHHLEVEPTDDLGHFMGLPVKVARDDDDSIFVLSIGFNLLIY